MPPRPPRRPIVDPALASVVAATTFAASLASAQPVKPDTLEGYDFGHVVERLSSSIDPLEAEMDSSFGQFVTAVDQAEAMLAEGKTREALSQCATAVKGVLDARDRVLDPMWEGQEYLTTQIAWVRSRLARAVAHDRAGQTQKADARSESMLNGIAARIPHEADPVRKKWLIAHYRTVRDLAQIKRMTDRLSPDQRKLWINVLAVLDEASLAHQQVLMGSEVLFAQFEATGARLDEYLTLLETVDGASELLEMVRGMGSATGEMGDFTASMTQLQERLGGFNQAVEGALRDSVLELEQTIDTIGDDAGSAHAPVVSVSEIDRELADRITRITGAPPQN